MRQFNWGVYIRHMLIEYIADIPGSPQVLNDRHISLKSDTIQVVPIIFPREGHDRLVRVASRHPKQGEWAMSLKATLKEKKNSLSLECARVSNLSRYEWLFKAVMFGDMDLHPLLDPIWQHTRLLTMASLLPSSLCYILI